MKLTKSKLKQIIKEELSLMGSLEIEENFVKKNDIQLDEETEEEFQAEKAKIMGFGAEKEEDIYLSLQQAYKNLHAALDVASRIDPGLALEIAPIAHALGTADNSPLKKLSSLLEE
jgi:hypothetical protein